MLEQAAAEAAAPVLKGNVEPLRQCLDQLRSAALAHDREGYATHDIDFHRGIVEAADNKVLLQTWDSLGFDVRLRIMLARKEPDLPRFAACHDPILDALEAGDGSTAGRLLREHAESFMGPGKPRPCG